MNYEAAVEKLKLEYKEIFTKENGKPAWAYHKKTSPLQLIMPTIPFVGKNYFEQTKKYYSTPVLKISVITKLWIMWII